MGFFEKRFAKQYEDIRVDLDRHADRIPATDANGHPIDKRQIKANATTVLDFIIADNYAVAKRVRKPTPEDLLVPAVSALTLMVGLCDYRNWANRYPDGWAPVVFDIALASNDIIGRMTASGDYNATQAWTAISNVYFRVLESTGIHEEVMLAVQRYAGKQR